MSPPHWLPFPNKITPSDSHKTNHKNLLKKNQTHQKTKTLKKMPSPTLTNATTLLLCDSCKTTSASLYCKADSAYLCIPCDTTIHHANKLASRHARVWLCDVCEHAPARVTCKADAANLCVDCDRDIHEVNPLARRHERVAAVEFYDCVAAAREARECEFGFGFDVNVAAEEEAASWLRCGDDVADVKKGGGGGDVAGLQSDGVVPVSGGGGGGYDDVAVVDVVEGLPAYDVEYGGVGNKPFMYNFTAQSISQSVSSSSLEVGVVPDHNTTMADVSNHHHHNQSSTEVYPTPLMGLDREARVLRYKEKRKNRKFEKTIRYASRKAYAETRPRIKGRFAKRTTDESVISHDSSYGVVPSY
ncbi:zinc finger protein CONSTANS-LIKE 4 [Artemisia annua]|uniref:Zinc finger protein CONSTANS-LIKE 4 n=1 Tax=Artemisia annua TaxID=35608 RepID=A0A2U1P6V4_ARTAN|nr:zinc finger protein CONSTANS-LIKE 4 [Artemisia annua]